MTSIYSCCLVKTTNQEKGFSKQNVAAKVEQSLSLTADTYATLSPNI